MVADAAGHSVAVIGGGLVGLSLAWKLAQDGFPVTIFEKNALVGREASWAGAGMLAPGGEMDVPSRLTSLALASRRIYPSFVRELERASGIAIDYQQCGALDVAYDRAAWETLAARAERQTSLGIASRPLTGAQVKTMWPRVRSEGLQGALFYPDDATVNPRDLVAALAAACRRANVRLREQTAVEAMAVTANGVRVSVLGAEETFAAAVIAAGAWSSLIAVANVPPLPAAAPVKGHLVGFAQPDQTCNTIVRHGHTYLLQRQNGLLIAGASVEHAGFDRSIDPAIADALAREAGSVLPHLAETTPSEVWTGFRPGSDELHIEQWSSPYLYLAYGHYRNGILLAPATALEIAGELSANLGKPPRGFASGHT